MKDLHFSCYIQVLSVTCEEKVRKSTKQNDVKKNIIYIFSPANKKFTYCVGLLTTSFFVSRLNNWKAVRTSSS